MAHKKKQKIPLWSIPCLVLAGGLLTLDRLGYDSKLEQLMSDIAGNPDLVQAALSSEAGTLGWESVSEHAPAPVSIEDIIETTALPDALTDAQSCDTNAENALVYESQFAPPDNVQKAVDTSNAPTETADGAPIKQLTITGKNGGYPGSDSVYVQNDSGLSYDLPSMLADPVRLKRNADTAQPTVLIVHTHASEAYVDQSDAHSEDTAHNVVHIGDVLTEVLQSKGIGVIHCRELIDVPSYNKSYSRAMTIIDEQLEKTPSIQMVIDLHRDSMITNSGTEYKVVSEIDGQTSAQLMFVMGTNAGGRSHPNWKQNLSFAAGLQKAILSEYPTLMRPINLRKQRFNEQATTGSMILECGTSANTIQEAELAIRAFGAVLAKQLE